ncbi:MAG TPA: 3-phosphoshikimate 1-carboxyvinyltransferase [Polyangiaceae bacterium]|nr:3-phosphoshikimate 1-carboxyvinyltransferase [Polyangiaceae bacterium]
MTPSLPDVLAIEPRSAPVNGTVRPPGSKSYTNRALVLAALASGRSAIEGALFSDDTLHMARALPALGVPVSADEGASRFVVDGCGGAPPAARASVFVGNSGTTARFLAAVMALGHGVYDLAGDVAMAKRPIQPLLDALHSLGVSATSIRGNGCPPVRVESSGVDGGAVQMPGGLSSQYFSALLMVGPCTRRGLTIDVDGELVSKPYIEVTAQAMSAFGATFRNEAFRRFEVPPGRYRAITYGVEPDASAASYFFAAAAVTGGRVVVPGLGARSLQGDLGFVRILERMGCRVRQTDAETEVCGPPKLRGIDVDMSDLSDTAQTLAAIAPFAEGPTRVAGIGFIRRKETNRIAAVVTELRRLGVRAEEEDDGFVVHPGAPRPADVETYDDHRMAMSFAIAGLVAPGVRIRNPGCVSKTFPGFFDALGALGS